MKGIYVITLPDRSGSRGLKERIYPEAIRRELAEKVSFFETLASADELEPRREELRQVEVIFTTWGMLALSEGQIQDYFPSLRAVFYGAGTVQGFARPYLNRGVRIFSAASANAFPVAEYTAAQIVLANKGFFQASRLYQKQEMKAARAHAMAMPGNYGTKVGIIGAGMIGKRVIGLLKNYRLEIEVFDPFLPQDQADALGVCKTELPELFSECQVISNHLANNDQTRGMLDYALFSRMKPSAVFINTGRGAQVVEADLVRALREEPGRTAVLDVTDPEPVQEGHPFYELPNVILTPHIAGSMAGELARMGTFMRDAFLCYEKGEPSGYEVTLPMLETMA
ncbi:MAG: hydroxyacid dehydrogenase [Provencibacterium sp.]|jgi:phosphoglycerate dehydrogenase-like enzyme|nr:hydroxyacid dehydrogenase [Provencibacterium sp.]